MNTPQDYILDFLSRQGPVTVEDYVGLNWPGMTFEDLGAEDRAEVEDLIAEGVLKVPTQFNCKYKH